MPLGMSRARLIQALDEAERHITSSAHQIERQRQIIRELESAGPGQSTTAETARALLASMERAHKGYIEERETIRQSLAR